jgi:hypothetical protein
MPEDRLHRSPRSSGMAEGVAAAVRRRQRERGPRVLIYDPDGHSRSIAPSAPGYDEILGVAQEMTEAVEAASRAATSTPRRERRRRAAGGTA